MTALLEQFTCLTVLCQVLTALLEYLDFFNGIKDLAVRALYLLQIPDSNAEILGHYAHMKLCKHSII